MKNKWVVFFSPTDGSTLLSWLHGEELRSLRRRWLKSGQYAFSCQHRLAKRIKRPVTRRSSVSGIELSCSVYELCGLNSAVGCPMRRVWAV